jgi:hypothetical protein
MNYCDVGWIKEEIVIDNGWGSEEEEVYRSYPWISNQILFGGGEDSDSKDSKGCGWEGRGRTVSGGALIDGCTG